MAMGADCSFELISIEIYAPQFIGLNKSDALYPKQMIFDDCWGSFEDLWQDMSGLFGSLENSNLSKNGHFTPV